VTRALALVLLVGCATPMARPVPRYEPIYSRVTGTYVTAEPCDWVPLVDHRGRVIGCIHLNAKE
jgi:hypothetical protein